MRSALTLIELVVTIALIALVAIPSVLAVSSSRANQALRASVDNLIIVLQRAHIYARENKGDVAWGVRCNDGMTYSMISGTTAAVVPAANYGLDGPIKFKNGCDWGDIWFERGSGVTTSSRTIIIAANTGKEASVIISKDGVIQEGL